jgi:spore coat protein CotF
MPMTRLDHLIDDVTGRTLLMGVSQAVEKIAEEIAKETLKDPEFRKLLQASVKMRSRALLEQLLAERPPEANGKPA